MTYLASLCRGRFYVEETGGNYSYCVGNGEQPGSGSLPTDRSAPDAKNNKNRLKSQNTVIMHSHPSATQAHPGKRLAAIYR